MSIYFPRVAVVNASGQILRYIPREAARVLVASGTVAPRHSTGRIREVELVSPACTYAARIGPPSAPAIGGTKFTRWIRLDQSATRIIEHHPRALYVL